MIHHISHIDMDGVGCQIVCNYIYRNEPKKFYNIDYSEVDQTITEVLNSTRKGDRVLITDISPSSPKTIALLDKMYAERLKHGISIILVDHHKTALDKLGNRPWTDITTDCCATKKLYNRFINDNQSLLNFTIMVNDYDLWIHNDPRSRRFNQLFWTIGPEKFRDRFTNNLSLDETESETVIINAMIAVKNDYVKNAVKTASIAQDEDGTTYAELFAERHQGDIGEHILSMLPNVKYVLIYNAQQKTASLRSRTGEYDVSALAKKRGGGGHQPASGYLIHDIRVI